MAELCADEILVRRILKPMPESKEREERMTKSWDVNAAAWVKAVRHQLIPSRTQATDAAIVKAVLDQQPHRVLDLGCGEGWLVRALNERGINVLGVDGSEALIASAREKGGGTFHACAYTDLAAAWEKIGSDFDVIVSNFALLQEDVIPVLGAVGSVLPAGGTLIIQTVHPWAVGETDYVDHWIEETFETISADFAESMPWYFRTLESWTDVLMQTNYLIRELREPRAPELAMPLSLIMIATPVH